MANQPSYIAYTTIKRKNQPDFFLQIGAAFMHEVDGAGYNIILQALPIPNGDGQCKIVLRLPKQNGEDVYEQPREEVHETPREVTQQRQTIRAENDRRKGSNR